MKVELEIVNLTIADVVATSPLAPGACGDTDNVIVVPCGGPLD